METWKVLCENLLPKIVAFKNLIASEARIFLKIMKYPQKNWKWKTESGKLKVENVVESNAESNAKNIEQKSIWKRTFSLGNRTHNSRYKKWRIVWLIHAHISQETLS